MDKTPAAKLLAPRIEDGRPLLIAGFAEAFSFENLSGLPALWRHFREHSGNIPGRVGAFAYGVCYKPDETGRFDYIAGVEVMDSASLPVGLDRLRLNQQRYAVFTHQEHVSSLRATFMAIFNDWLPHSGYQNADAPPFERYDQRFDASSGLGGLEVWIPIK